MHFQGKTLGLVTHTLPKDGWRVPAKNRADRAWGWSGRPLEWHRAAVRRSPCTRPLAPASFPETWRARTSRRFRWTMSWCLAYRLAVYGHLPMRPSLSHKSVTDMPQRSRLSENVRDAVQPACVRHPTTHCVRRSAAGFKRSLVLGDAWLVCVLTHMSRKSHAHWASGRRGRWSQQDCAARTRVRTGGPSRTPSAVNLRCSG